MPEPRDSEIELRLRASDTTDPEAAGWALREIDELRANVSRQWDQVARMEQWFSEFWDKIEVVRKERDLAVSRLEDVVRHATAPLQGVTFYKKSTSGEWQYMDRDEEGYPGVRGEGSTPIEAIDDAVRRDARGRSRPSLLGRTHSRENEDGFQGREN